MSFVITPIAVSVHTQGQSPIFGVGATHVFVDDVAAGPFLRLKQTGDARESGEVRLDLEELEAIVIAARRLMKAQPKVAE